MTAEDDSLDDDPVRVDRQQTARGHQLMLTYSQPESNMFMPKGASGINLCEPVNKPSPFFSLCQARREIRNPPIFGTARIQALDFAIITKWLPAFDISMCQHLTTVPYKNQGILMFRNYYVYCTSET